MRFCIQNGSWRVDETYVRSAVSGLTSSIYQEAHSSESVVPVGRRSIEDDRWLRSDASDQERANPVAAAGRRGWATPVHSYPLWHRCVVPLATPQVFPHRQTLFATDPLKCLKRPSMPCKRSCREALTSDIEASVFQPISQCRHILRTSSRQSSWGAPRCKRPCLTLRRPPHQLR